jgi:hypothetical protein
VRLSQNGKRKEFEGEKAQIEKIRVTGSRREVKKWREQKGGLQ